MTNRNWVCRLLARAPRRAPQGSRKASARVQPRRVRLCLEALEDRVLPTLGTPTWLDVGPGPRIDSSTTGLTSQQNPTTGAVNAVVVSPVNPNTLFAATVNGGIWRTDDGNDLNPIWKPLTDTAASLSISDIAFSPLDASNKTVTANTPAGNLVLYAGTGSLSSKNGDGGPPVGLLKSVDGGSTWQSAGTNLPAEVVRNVVPTSLPTPTGQVVLVGMVNSGVWRSTDGGQSFTQISGNANVDGNNTPSGLPAGFGVTQLLADPGNPNRFYVALGAGGIYRSDNGGLVWTRIDNGANPITGLANAANVRLAASSANGQTVVYAAVVSGGTPELTSVFRSTDAGLAGTTTLSLTGRPVGLDTTTTLTVASAAGFPSSGTFTIRVDNELMTVTGGAGTTTWTVTRTAPVAHNPGAPVKLISWTTSWTAMDMPGTTSTVNGKSVFVGLNPGGQGAFNFSFTADPKNPNVVYIGGDRQPDLSEQAGGQPNGQFGSGNAVGATAYNGRLFRGDASQPRGINATTGLSNQWTPITDNFADVDGVQPAPDTTPGTSPHADSRSLLVTPSGSLLETDDGGIYRRSNPTSSTGTWTSLSGTLDDSELIGVAYNPLNNVILAGAQDNGTAVQSAYGDRQWRQIQGGDGGITQVDTTSSPGNAIYYYTTQNLGGFSRETLDSSNRIVGTPTPLSLLVPASTTLTAPMNATTDRLTVASAAGFPSSGTFTIFVDNEQMTVTAGAGTTTWTVTRGTNAVAHSLHASVLGFYPLTQVDTVGFYQPYVLNKVNPKRMLLGTTLLYESEDQGDVFSMPNGRTNMGQVSALAYGGFLGAQAAPDVAYVGTAGDANGNRLFLRQTAGGAFNPVKGYTGATPLGIVLDPSNWKTAYIIDSAGKVWRTLDATAANPTWDNITGNLNGPNSLGVTNLRTIEIIGSGANAGLFIGAGNGVYATDNAQPATNGQPGTTWVRFGTGLPNVAVDSLRYDSTANVLVAGTLGRGAWLVPNASAFVNQRQTPNQSPDWSFPRGDLNATVTGPLVFSAANNTPLQINDPDAGTGFEQVYLSVDNGRLKLASTTGLSFLLGNAGGGSALGFVGTLANINAALNGLTYTPDNGTTGLQNVLGSISNPGNGFHATSGTALMHVTVSDQQSSGTGVALNAAAVFPINVTLVNDAPVNTVPATQFVKTNSNNFSFSTATGNAIAIADGDSGTNPLLVTLAVNQGTLRINNTAVTFTAGTNNTAAATLTFSGTLNNLNAALQTLTYTPPANFQGTATLTVTTNDQGGTSPDGTRNDPRTATTTVGINVTTANLPPVIAVPATALSVAKSSVGAPTQLAFTGANAIRIRDNDAGDKPVTVILSVNQGILTFGGQGFANGNRASETLPIATINGLLAGMTYSPLADFQGPVMLTIIVNDNGNTGPGGATNDPKTTTQTVTINVGTAVRPSVAAPAEQSTAPGASMIFSAAAGNNISVATDPNQGDNLEVILSAAHGTLTLPNPTGLFFTVGDGTAAPTMTFSGSPVDIDRALNGLIYTPPAFFQGDDFVTVTVADPEALGDRTPPPPQNIIDDGGNGGDSGDPPPADAAGASPASSFPTPALLLSDTKTVVIHVQNAATTTPPPSPSPPPGSPPGSPPGPPPPSLLQAILDLYVEEVEKDIGFGDPMAVQQAIDFNARFTVLFGINIAPFIERIADANVASALGGGNA
jgi:hypothetical protein